MTTPRNATLATLGVAVIAAAAALATGSLLIDPAPTTVGGTAQSAHPSQVELACPAGLVDPFDTSNVARAATWSSLSASPITPAPDSITGTGGTIPTGLTLVGQGGGELAGLSAVGCAAPPTSQWIAAGAPTPVRRDSAGRDPALGSSVLIPAVTDSGGFLIFLGLATMFLL